MYRRALSSIQRVLYLYVFPKPLSILLVKVSLSDWKSSHFNCDVLP